MSVEKIELNNKLFALIARKGPQPDGVNFFTRESNSLQLGFIKHEKGSQVKPHTHKRQKKVIEDVQEILHIEYGKAEVNIYDDNGEKIASSILNEGDTILLVCGGHGFKILEDSKILEVKQGPYHGFESDKEYLEIGK